MNARLEMNSRLEEDGYILFKTVLSNKQLWTGLRSIKKQPDGMELIDYNELKANFIDAHFIPYINNELGWNAVYNKFRFSNKSNSRDASTFHADIYNFTYYDMPIYTCLEYFDKATLEIIPGSHKRNKHTTTDILHKARIKLIIVPGDILVFNSNLYHRGVFYEKGIQSRKLLQVFDVYPNKDIYDKYNDNYLTVTVNNSKLTSVVNEFSELTSNYKSLNELITYYHLWLVNNNIQYKLITYNTDNTNYKYYGYIPGNIDYISPQNELQAWNINIYVMPMTHMATANYNMLYFYILLLIIIWTVVYNRKKIYKYLVKFNKH